MPNINVYQNIDEIKIEARKDFVDRHSPFIYCDDEAKSGEVFEVKVQVGNKYPHPDDYNHYISDIYLYDRNVKLAQATFYAGTLGGQDKKGRATVVFNIVLNKNAKLTAHAYCTQHGIWQSLDKVVRIK
jgi:superoxide reductase